jgi:hypothetical protein
MPVSGQQDEKGKTMGIEIDKSEFDNEEWPRFSRYLNEETALLRERIREGRYSSLSTVGGFEIEAWLTDKEMRPALLNVEFLERFDSELATVELAKFNFELNNTPQPLRGNAFGKFGREMHRTCRKANRIAEEMGVRALTIGILPTLERGDFCLENMSEMKRYRALNDQVLKKRDGRPLELSIEGEEEGLNFEDDSVMLESAATSFQIHTQVPYEKAHHYYNASILLSAATVAISANSPFLFGKALWHETRIPLFEQSVDTGEGQKRVSFGSGFLDKELLQCFEENLQEYDVLLPIIFDGKKEHYEHLRLHNGTIWRWNRPLIGFDEDGTLHFRIEHRVMSAGPSLLDMLANAAFYYGAATMLSAQCEAGHFAADFESAERDFYLAARYGLEAETSWEGARVPIKRLILDKLLPLAAEGLAMLSIDKSDSDRYLGIVRERVERGQNGAAWQLAYVRRYGNDMRKLTEAYWEHQQSGEAVHLWEVK